MLSKWTEFTRTNPIEKHLLIGFAILIVWVFGRVAITHSIKNIYLIWNLFLAMVPYGIAYYLQKKHAALQPFVRWILLGLWVLFLPNASYIITDLVHVHPNNGIPLWFDYLKIFFAATLGLTWGFLSLQVIESIYVPLFEGKLYKWLRLLFFFIIAYGVYLGRFLRWNSWDVFIHPIEFMITVKGSICIETIGFVFGYGIILHSLYQIFIHIKMSESSKPNVRL